MRKGRPKHPDPIARFWEKVDKLNGPVKERLQTRCWEWKVHPSRKYGIFWLNGRYEQAHRVAYAYSNGIPLKKLDPVIRHICDNPRCCRPSHLIGGTQKDNIQDQLQRNQHTVQQENYFKPPLHSGLKHPKSVLTREMVIEARKRLSSKEPYKKIAEALGVSVGAICGIKRGSYKDVK